MELMFVLLMMGVFFYIAFIYLNVQYQIKGKQLVIRCAKETKSIPIDSIIEINETDYYEGTKETIVIGNTERTDYRFIILTKEKRYVLTGRMNNRLLTQLKEVNPAIRIFVKSLSWFIKMKWNIQYNELYNISFFIFSLYETNYKQPSGWWFIEQSIMKQSEVFYVQKKKGKKNTIIF